MDALESRVATTAAALVRLGARAGDGGGPAAVVWVGADRTEGGSAAEVAAAAAALAERLERGLALALVGPNVAFVGREEAAPGVSVVGVPKLWHELGADARAALLGGGGGCGGCTSALLLAFNAGVWGYDSWVATAKAAGAPLVVTAYSAEEADEDCDVLDAAGALFAWRDQPNPHRSAVHRRGSERDGDLNEERCDNHSWLCVDGWRHDGGGGDVR